MVLRITENIFNKMKDHARREYPFECCGFFFGSEKDNLREASEVFPVKNAKKGDKRRRFEVEPKDYMEAERRADATDLKLLGVYHSHPDHPARPSQHDRDQAVPDFSYIIISLNKSEVLSSASWRLTEKGDFEEEEIRLVERKQKFNHKI